MKKFLTVQRKKIEIDKWCEGVGIRRDPGQGYILDWIQKNAAWFRDEWEQSMCRTCRNWHQCGYSVQRVCKDYTRTPLT